MKVRFSGESTVAILITRTTLPSRRGRFPVLRHCCTFLVDQRSAGPGLKRCLHLLGDSIKIASHNHTGAMNIDVKVEKLLQGRTKLAPTSLPNIAALTSRGNGSPARETAN
jgi:hypothetical protein